MPGSKTPIFNEEYWKHLFTEEYQAVALIFYSGDYQEAFDIRVTGESRDLVIFSGTPIHFNDSEMDCYESLFIAFRKHKNVKVRVTREPQKYGKITECRFTGEAAG